MNTIQTFRKMKTNARMAGILYLVIIISGLFSEMFVRSGLISPEDAMATAQNISSNETLFRFGFFSDLLMVMSDVGVALLLYLLLKPVNKGLSMLASFFRLAQATVLGINLLNMYLPMLLLNNAGYLSSFSSEQINALVLLYLNAHSYGYLISGVFFGISCVVLGYLIFNSPNFPKWLGILVAAAGFSYLIDSLTNFLFPELASSSEYLVVSVAVLSELSLCMFLIIKGIIVKTP